MGEVKGGALVQWLKLGSALAIVSLAACFASVPQLCPSGQDTQCTCADGASGIAECSGDGTEILPCVCKTLVDGGPIPDAGRPIDAGEKLDSGS